MELLHERQLIQSQFARITLFTLKFQFLFDIPNDNSYLGFRVPLWKLESCVSVIDLTWIIKGWKLKVSHSHHLLFWSYSFRSSTFLEFTWSKKEWLCFNSVSNTGSYHGLVEKNGSKLHIFSYSFHILHWYRLYQIIICGVGRFI